MPSGRDARKRRDPSRIVSSRLPGGQFPFRDGKQKKFPDRRESVSLPLAING